MGSQGIGPLEHHKALPYFRKNRKTQTSNRRLHLRPILLTCLSVKSRPVTSTSRSQSIPLTRWHQMKEGYVKVSGRVVTDFVSHGTYQWMIVLKNHVLSLMLPQI